MAFVFSPSDAFLLASKGHRHFSGLEEALLKNINACKEISNMTKTSLGPNGERESLSHHFRVLIFSSVYRHEEDGYQSFG